MTDFNIVFSHQHPTADLSRLGHDAYSFHVSADSADEAIGLATIRFHQTHPQLVHSDYLPKAHPIQS